MSKAWWINSQLRLVISVDCNGLKDMNKYVGSICIGKVWHETGDVLYVDDDGMLKPQEYWFMVPGQPQPLAGDGIIVGKEVETENGWYNLDVIIGIEQLGIKWMSKEEVQEWGRLNKDRPSFMINDEVVERYGETIKRATGETEL